MQKYDVLIVGGGMVGLTLALGLVQKTALTVAIIDTQPLNKLSDVIGLRFSAINGASQQILSQLGVWPTIAAMRHCPYQAMQVWDKDGHGQLSFSHNDVNRAELGWIVENDIIRNALWQQAEQHQQISLFTQEPILSLAVGDSEVFASFAKQAPITAKLVVGADGANSWLRQQLAMPISFRDYDHHALVANIHCPQGHQNTAWQVFLPEGPLAFLPTSDAKVCSIVWSMSPESAIAKVNEDEQAFNKALTAATDGKFGAVTLQSARASFPLTMRLAHDFFQARVALIGDAAHTIHPLAGQGVNLGFLDAAALVDIIVANVVAHKDIANYPSLAQFSRWRKAHASEMVVAMEAIKQSFTPQQGIAKLVRGVGMSLINNVKPIKKLLVKQALGERDDLPSLAKYHDPL